MLSFNAIAIEVRSIGATAYVVAGVKIVSAIGIEVLLALATAGVDKRSKPAAKGAKAVKNTSKIKYSTPIIKVTNNIAGLNES